MREIVISRLFGHGMLPMRPEMLEVADTVLAYAYCKGETVPWSQVSREVYDDSMAGQIIPDMSLQYARTVTGEFILVLTEKNSTLLWSFIFLRRARLKAVTQIIELRSSHDNR